MIFNRNLTATNTADTTAMRQRLARQRLQEQEDQLNDRIGANDIPGINPWEPTEGDPVDDPRRAGEDIAPNGELPDVEFPGDEMGTVPGDPGAKYGEDKEPTEIAKESDESYLDKLYKDYINDLKGRSKEGRDALAGQLDQASNEALMTQEAKAGAAGLGLSGAAQSIQGGLTAQLARQRALGLDEYDRAQRRELIGGISEFGDYVTDKRETEMSQADRALYRDFLERQADEDLDNDGDVGGKPVGENIGDGDIDNNDYGDFGDETTSHPVTPEERKDWGTDGGPGGSGRPMNDTSTVDVGEFKAGDEYQGSDDHWDVYWSVDEETYYKVRYA